MEPRETNRAPETPIAQGGCRHPQAGACRIPQFCPFCAEERFWEMFRQLAPRLGKGSLQAFCVGFSPRSVPLDPWDDEGHLVACWNAGTQALEELHHENRGDGVLVARRLGAVTSFPPTAVPELRGFLHAEDGDLPVAPEELVQRVRDAWDEAPLLPSEPEVRVTSVGFGPPLRDALWAMLRPFDVAAALAAAVEHLEQPDRETLDFANRNMANLILLLKFEFESRPAIFGLGSLAGAVRRGAAMKGADSLRPYGGGNPTILRALLSGVS